MAKGQDVYTVNLNNVDHDFKDKGAHSDISVVNAQIETLSQQIQTMSLNMQTLQTSLNQAKQQLQGLQAIVPQEASSENTLADKDYVDTQVEDAKDYTDNQVSAIIDDASTSNTTAYSSQKTNDEIADKTIDLGGVHYKLLSYTYTIPEQQPTSSFFFIDVPYCHSRYKPIVIGDLLEYNNNYYSPNGIGIDVLFNSNQLRLILSSIPTESYNNIKGCPLTIYYLVTIDS